ncbi:hypothetical protein D3C81_1375410 [compost metagenome]
MGAFGGDQRHQKDCQQVGHCQWGAGGIGDEDNGQGQVDRKTVEVKGVAGRDHQADGGITDTQVLEFAHDLRQDSIGRRSTQDNGQLFAQVFDERQDAQTRQAHHRAQDQQYETHAGQIEQRNQAAQVLQRFQAIFAGGEGDGTEHTQRRQAHDHAHDAEDHMAQFIDQP